MAQNASGSLFFRYNILSIEQGISSTLSVYIGIWGFEWKQMYKECIKTSLLEYLDFLLQIN